MHAWPWHAVLNISKTVKHEPFCNQLNKPVNCKCIGATKFPTRNVVVTESPTINAITTESPTSNIVITESLTSKIVVTESPTLSNVIITESPTSNNVITADIDTSVDGNTNSLLGTIKPTSGAASGFSVCLFFLVLLFRNHF